jgi:hypothetical protein
MLGGGFGAGAVEGDLYWRGAGELRAGLAGVGGHGAGLCKGGARGQACVRGAPAAGRLAARQEARWEAVTQPAGMGSPVSIRPWRGAKKIVLQLGFPLPVLRPRDIHRLYVLSLLH